MNSAIIHKGTQTPGRMPKCSGFRDEQELPSGRPLTASCAVHGCTSAASAGCAGAALPQHSCIHTQRREERKRRVPQEQQGSVLIVSMVILLVLTLIGVTAMGTSALEEKMAGNSRDQNQAFQAAEAALRDAEAFIGNLATTAAFNGGIVVVGLFPIGANPPIFSGATWTLGAARTLVGGNVLPNAASGGVNNQPLYIVEMVTTVGTPPVTLGGGYGGGGGGGTTLATFRITARGTGGTDNATVLLQSYFSRNF